jgi:mRNA interferase HigB
MVSTAMRIIARRTLREYVDRLQGRPDQAAVSAALDSWFTEVSRERWRNAAELKQRYRTASIIDAERVVFNIKGNDYRLVVAVDYEKAAVWIKWLGTHREYDRIDVKKVEHGR